MCYVCVLTQTHTHTHTHTHTQPLKDLRLLYVCANTLESGSGSALMQCRLRVLRGSGGAPAMRSKSCCRCRFSCVCYLCVLILLYMCPQFCYMCVLNTAIYVSSSCYRCVLNTATYVSSYCYMCPHTTTYVSSYSYICVLILLAFEGDMRSTAY
jgi:hypothetical protein